MRGAGKVVTSRETVSSLVSAHGLGSLHGRTVASRSGQMSDRQIQVAREGGVHLYPGILTRSRTCTLCRISGTGRISEGLAGI